MNLKEISFYKMFVGVALNIRDLENATKLNPKQLGMLMWCSNFDTFTLRQFKGEHKKLRLIFYLTVQELMKKGFIQEIATNIEITYSITNDGRDMVNKIKMFLAKNNPLKPKYAKAADNGGLRDKIPITQLPTE